VSEDEGVEPVECYAHERVADLVELLMLHYDDLSAAEACNELFFALTAYVEGVVGLKAAEEPLLSLVKTLSDEDVPPTITRTDPEARVLVLKRLICDHGKPYRGPNACSECVRR
jgi:hypothetical protein